MARNRDAAVSSIREAARPLRSLHDLDGLLDLVGDARVVLLGGSTHGTREFHRLRAALTRRLILDKGFNAVAVEADWSAALRASRWVQGRSRDADATRALAGFDAFLHWPWRNTATVRLLQWLRAYNERQAPPGQSVGLHGLDFHNLHESLRGVLHDLQEVDPEAARRARARCACLDDVAHHPQACGHAVHFGLRADHERQLVDQLAGMLRQAGARLTRDGGASGDALFHAQQNARAVRDAESHYRALFAGRTDAWNARERHLAATLQALREHLARRHGRAARVVVWAHNAHTGDARATDCAGRGQVSLGQLVREQQADPQDSFLLGFTTHAGTVTAAPDWEAPAGIQAVQPSRIDSVERLLHESGVNRFVLPLTTGAPEHLRRALLQPRLERAMGAVYRPETERRSHYFHARLAAQFDAVVHLDHTHALRPLEGENDWAGWGDCFNSNNNPG